MSQSPGPAPKTQVLLLFVVLVAAIAAGTTTAGAVAARRARSTGDPLAPKAQAWQYLAAGPLTAASAALMVPLLRASPAVHYLASCRAAHPANCTAAPAVWTFFLVVGPLLGLAFGTCLGSLPADQPPPKPPHDPPQSPPASQSQTTPARAGSS